MSSARVSHAFLRRVLVRASVVLSSGAALGLVGCAGRIADADRRDAGGPGDGAEAGVPADPASSADAGQGADARDAPDAADGGRSASCDGRIPLRSDGRPDCYAGAGPGGAPSATFDLAGCGLASSDCTQFCTEQNPTAGYGTGCSTSPADGVPPGKGICTCGSRGGRPPEGLDLAPRAVRNLGDFFAASAEAEAASIDAFEILAGELSAHRAPGRLVRASRAAARDERRHATAMGALAAERGAAPRPTPVVRGPVRSLEAIALENAVVGCVLETYAALVVQWQADHARDHAVALAVGSIARDEARHAALSWRLHAWLLERLPDDARGRVSARLEETLRQLSTRVEPDDFAERDTAGLPTKREARALAAALAQALLPTP